MRLQLTFLRSKYMVAGLLGLFLTAKSQDTTQLYSKKKVSKTEIETLFSYYTQDGNNSAVTGGTGTEKLSVYAPSIRIKHHFNDNNQLQFKGGVDVISSASVDQIDFVVSSASRKDGHSYLNMAYSRIGKDQLVTLTAGSGMSIESDYLSILANIHANGKTKNEKFFYEMGLRTYQDDLRWGRLNPDHYKPVELIYPDEINDTAWFDIYNRRSYMVQAGLSAFLNDQLFVGLFSGLTYQTGLLSTPFHRVYFNNATVRVENLPRKRIRFPLGIKVNYLLQNNILLKGNLDFYIDNFGIKSSAISLEPLIDLNWKMAVSPFFRFYIQSKSNYFMPYQIHEPTNRYYTSDYDLSAFQSIKTGMEFKFSPRKFYSKYSAMDYIALRYAYYHRNNHLDAHILSLLINWQTINNKL